VKLRGGTCIQNQRCQESRKETTIPCLETKQTQVKPRTPPGYLKSNITSNTQNTQTGNKAIVEQEKGEIKKEKDEKKDKEGDKNMADQNNRD